jgi:hypothetical protein
MNGKFPNCASNSIKFDSFRLFCWKCCWDEEKKGRDRSFPTCRKLFRHIIQSHSGSDKNEFPTKDSCIEMLQQISNAIVIRMLR